MPYGFPPVTINFTTAALVVGTIGPTNTVVAPNYGGSAIARYRVHSWSAVMNTNIGVGVVIHGFFDTGLGVIRFALNGGADRMVEVVYPFPGLICDPANRLPHSITSTVAGGTMLLTLRLYTDGL